VSGGSATPAEPAQSPIELRARADRYREYASSFPDVEQRQRVLDLADELDTRADALEARHPCRSTEAPLTF
jgi:hypothetical protein